MLNRGLMDCEKPSSVRRSKKAKVQLGRLLEISRETAKTANVPT
uniref:Uncharacterized protein n=1 Tax=Anguilla anguilla TaxID=7936 RepID=A0A0E9PCI9_ANGAN